MSPQPHEGPAEEGLSSAILRLAGDPDRIDQLRPMLSGFSHRWRNTLNGIKLALYLFRRDPGGEVPQCWSDLERTYEEVERFFDRLQAIYRPVSLTMVRSRVGQLISDRIPSWRSLFLPKGRAIRLDPPSEDLPGDFDPIRLGSSLDAFVAWRAEAGEEGCNSRLGWRTSDGFFELAWNESRSSIGTIPGNLQGEQRHDTKVGEELDPLALPLLARTVVA